MHQWALRGTQKLHDLGHLRAQIKAMRILCVREIAPERIGVDIGVLDVSRDVDPHRARPAGARLV
jgi:hypothetical protein